jgi:hypothetical protein
MTVELNQEILVKVGDGRSGARVTKVEETTEGDKTSLPGQCLLNLQVAI